MDPELYVYKWVIPSNASRALHTLYLLLRVLRVGFRGSRVPPHLSTEVVIIPQRQIGASAGSERPCARLGSHPRNGPHIDGGERPQSGIAAGKSVHLQTAHMKRRAVFPAAELHMPYDGAAVERIDADESVHDGIQRHTDLTVSIRDSGVKQTLWHGNAVRETEREVRVSAVALQRDHIQRFRAGSRSWGGRCVGYYPV